MSMPGHGHVMSHMAYVTHGMFMSHPCRAHITIQDSCMHMYHDLCAYACIHIRIHFHHPWHPGAGNAINLGCMHAHVSRVVRMRMHIHAHTQSLSLRPWRSEWFAANNHVHDRGAGNAIMSMKLCSLSINNFYNTRTYGHTCMHTLAVYIPRRPTAMCRITAITRIHIHTDTHACIHSQYICSSPDRHVQDHPVRTEAWGTAVSDIAAIISSASLKREKYTRKTWRAQFRNKTSGRFI